MKWYFFNIKLYYYLIKLIFQIKKIWFPLYRLNFLKSALSRAHDCHKGYYLYQQGLESDVSLKYAQS